MDTDDLIKTTILLFILVAGIMMLCHQRKQMITLYTQPFPNRDTGGTHLMTTPIRYKSGSFDIIIGEEPEKPSKREMKPVPQAGASSFIPAARACGVL